MRRGIAIGFFVLCMALNANHGFAQDPSIEQLRQQIEILELKLQLAKQESERLEAECDELRKQNASLKGVTVDSTQMKEDPFQVGNVWAGEAINNAKVNYKWALSISERSGPTFKGAIAVINDDGKKFEFPVSGKAPVGESGLVEFESPVIGRAKLFMRGTLRNGSIALAFSGTSPLGQKFFGSAALSPKQ